MSGDTDEFDLFDVCEAEEIYVTASRNGLNESPDERGRGLTGRDRIQ